MTAVFPIERKSQRNIIATSVVFTVLAITACLLRLLARRVAHRVLDASDWCIFASCFVTVIYQTINVASVFICGVGYHYSEIIAAHGMGPITLFLKFLIAIQLLWALSLSLCKISILIMYSKIFTIRSFIWTARITGAVIVMWASATILLGFLTCQPFAFNWDPSLPGGHCGDQILSYEITGALNLVTDLVVLGLPLQYLYNLNLALYKKIVLMATFSVGIFTCVVTILRLVSITSVNYADITFNILDGLLFSGLEPCLAVTLACVPVLQPLARLGSWRTTAGGSSGKVSARGSDFRQLNDNSSQYQLRPVGPKHMVDARAQHSSGSALSSETEGRRDKAEGVVVKTEWRIASEDV